MRTYYLNDEQKKLLDAFAEQVKEQMICDLSDDMESPLDPYDQTGHYDNAKMDAMLHYIVDQIKSYI